MDCGPTCLRMVAKHYKRSIPFQLLREKTQIGKEGVNLLGVSEAAEAVGFRTKAVKTFNMKARAGQTFYCANKPVRRVGGGKSAWYQNPGRLKQI